MERKSKELMFISMDQHKSNFKDKFFKKIAICVYVCVILLSILGI